MNALSSPYPGLRPFGSDEADLFFGREEQVDELLRRLHTTRFLAVVGPSGCGKSSLVRAGMIAALEAGFLVSAGSRWRFAILRPGGQPMTELATALVARTGLADDSPDSHTAIGMLGATLRRGPLGLVEALRENPLPTGTNLLVLVDQFEEIFRFRREGGVDEADAFVALLLESARQREVPIYVVLTMRSDFFGDCAAFGGLPEALNQSQYLTPRLSRDQRRLAIVGPARVFGGDVAPELVNRLLNEMGNDPDQLPLMQHLLMRMWTWRTPTSSAPTTAATTGDTAPPDDAPRHLTLADYEAVGGLRHALSNHANEAFGRLDPRQQAIAETLFRRLSERAPGSRDIRRPTPVGEVAALADATTAELSDVIYVFRAPGCSFVVPAWPRPLDDDTMLDITHEALIRQWDKLRAWADEEAQSADHYRFLERNAQLWRQGRMALWGTPNLEMALDWREREQPSALWAQRYGGDFAEAMTFLEASAEARDKQEAAQQALRLQQVRHLRHVSIVAVCAALVLAGALGAVYWFEFAAHVSYYRSFVTRWGEPVGTGPLTEAQTHHRPYSLRLTQRGIHADPHSWWGFAYTTNQMEAVDADGRCTPDNDVTTFLSESDEDILPTHECRWVFVRDATTGQLVYENAYDRTGALRWGYEYLPGATDPVHRVAYYIGPNGALANFKNSPASVVHFTFSSQGDLMRTGYFDRDGRPEPGPDHAYGRRFEYNRLGMTSAMVSVDLAGKDMDDTAGNAGIRLAYDAQSNETTEEAFDSAGRPGLVKDGWHKAKTEFDPYGNKISFAIFDQDDHPVADKSGIHLTLTRRDDKGRQVSIKYYDTAGKPVDSTDGYQRIEVKTVGLFGRWTEWAYFDADGHPATDSSGAHAYRRTYDENGFLRTSKAFGPDLQPVAAADGCYEERFTPDAEGNDTTIACFDRDGKRALTDSGNHSVQIQYDDRGNVTEKAAYGPDGRPVINNEGYHIVRYRYDLLGKVEETAFFGVDGYPATSTEGYHRVVTQHDSRGNETVRTYFDEDAQPTHGPRDFAKRVTKYDEHDNPIETAYYDADGEFTDASKDAEGFAIVRKKFDDHWRTLEVSYFGSNAKPKALSDGIATQRFHYAGNVTETRYFDAAGQPVRSTDGCAGYRAVSDTQYQKVLDWVCIDAAGQRTASSNGVAAVRSKYDAHGNLVRRAYFGLHDDPMPGPDGTAVYHARYDGAGREVERSFSDADDTPRPGPNGIAFTRTRYDPAGRQIEMAFFDTQQKAFVAEDGYATQRMRYDDHGKLVEEAYFGADGLPVQIKDGYHRIEARYNERGRIVERSYHAANGDLVQLPKGYAIKKTRYDDSGKITEEAYYGPDERPVVSADGYHRTSMRYDERGRQVEQAYYDADGRLLPHGGYAIWRAQYDEQGRLAEEAYFGADDKPVSLDDSYHRMVAHHAGQGDTSETVYYDADGHMSQPAAQPFAMSRTEQAFYGPDGRLIAHCTIDANTTTESVSGCQDAAGHHVEHRVTIIRVAPGTQAARLGLQPGDVIEAYGGQAIYEQNELQRLINETPPGERSLTIRRGGQPTTVTVAPGRLGITSRMQFMVEDAPAHVAN